MAKDEREHVKPARDDSRGQHGGNRGGQHDKKEQRDRSDPAAGKDPHRGNR